MDSYYSLYTFSIDPLRMKANKLNESVESKHISPVGSVRCWSLCWRPFFIVAQFSCVGADKASLLCLGL